MRPHFIMFMALILISGVMLSHLIQGTFFGTTDEEMMNSLMAFRSTTVFGLWTVPVPNLSFVTTGLYNLATFNFAFFDTVPGGFIRYFFYVFAQGMFWGVLVVFSVVLFRLFGR